MVKHVVVLQHNDFRDCFITRKVSQDYIIFLKKQDSQLYIESDSNYARKEHVNYQRQEIKAQMATLVVFE